MLTPEQSRAARGLLDWSQAELARRSGLSESTIRDFEKGRRVPSINNVKAIVAAFLSAGVALLDDGTYNSNGGRGVRFVTPSEIAKLKFKLNLLNETIDDMRLNIEHTKRVLSQYKLDGISKSSLSDALFSMIESMDKLVAKKEKLEESIQESERKETK